MWDRLSWKSSLLVRSEILGLFVNGFTADEKYSRHNREKIPQPVQMQLSKKNENFLWKIPLRFWNLNKISNIFRKKVNHIA